MHYVEKCDERIELTQDVLLQLGIDSEEALDIAFNNTEFANKYIRTSKHDTDTYEYVRSILERSKNNILSYLDRREEYDITDMRSIANTILSLRRWKRNIFIGASI